MTQQQLFRYYKRHQSTFNPAAWPDYTKRRGFSAPPVPSDIDFEETLIAGVPGEWIRLKGRKPRRIVLFIHGGGFTSLDKGYDRNACFYIAQYSRCDVYNTNYALAPEHPFPQGLDDCYDVYCALASEYGASRIVIMAESAGGTLALGLCLRAKVNGIGLPCCLVLCSPPVQCVDMLESYTTNLGTDCMVSNHVEEAQAVYYRSRDRSYLSKAEASPIYGDFTGFPPTLIFASDSEVLLDDSILLEKRMVEQGVFCVLEVGHNMMHVYPTLVGLKECRPAMDRALAFIAKN